MPGCVTVTSTPNGKRSSYLTTKTFCSCVTIKLSLFARVKNEQVLNKNKVLEEYGIHPRNFAWARAVVGDKSDNLDGVKGLGLKTMAKRFPFLSENKDYGLEDIMSHARNNKNKIKAYQNVLDNEEIIASNYEIMQLYISTISPQGVNKLKYAIQNDGVDLNRTKIRTMLLKDGIGTLNIDELMLMLNSHKKVMRAAFTFSLDEL